MLVSGEVINVIKGFICHIDDSDKGGAVNKAQREGAYEELLEVCRTKRFQTKGEVS